MDNQRDIAKPELLHKLEGCTDEVNGAIVIPGENAVISISNDRSVRIWLLRDSGQFWPSICHYMSAAATSMSYTHDSRKLFVGLESGVVEEFTVARDYNRMDSVRVYHAHQARVTDTIYTSKSSWLLSSGRDKYFHFHCASTGKRLGGYLCNAWCTSIAYDDDAQYVFIGDYSGAITVCHLEQTGVKFINTLKGHSGSVRTLAWDGRRNWLYSGSFDNTVFVWVSASTTAADAARPCVCDNCQLCNRPFFWNLKSMYDQKQMGLRQEDHADRQGARVRSESL